MNKKHEQPYNAQEVGPQDEKIDQINFIREETIKAIEKIRGLDIVKKADELNRKIPNEYPYHKNHTTNPLNSPFYQIIFLVLYDRYYLNQFEHSSDDRFLELCGIAAAYHDTGFVNGPKGHETRSAQNAKDAMEQHGYSKVEIEQVVQAILDTQVEMTPYGAQVKKDASSPIAGFLMDADVSNFGTAENTSQTELVAEELHIDPYTPEYTIFLKQTLHLMETHSWKTNAAKRLFQEQKDINISRLKNQIEVQLGKF